MNWSLTTASNLLSHNPKLRTRVLLEVDQDHMKQKVSVQFSGPQFSYWLKPVDFCWFELYDLHVDVLVLISVSGSFSSTLTVELCRTRVPFAQFEQFHRQSVVSVFPLAVLDTSCTDHRTVAKTAQVFMSSFLRVRLSWVWSHKTWTWLTPIISCLLRRNRLFCSL